MKVLRNEQKIFTTGSSLEVLSSLELPASSPYLSFTEKAENFSFKNVIYKNMWLKWIFGGKEEKFSRKFRRKEKTNIFA